MDKIQLLESIDFQDLAPRNVRKVVMVSGTMYEMGYQYGEQACEEIKRSACLVKAAAIQMGKPLEVVMEDVLRTAEIAIKKTPEINEFFHGAADGSKLPYEDILTVNCWSNAFLPSPDIGCSSVSAWGSASKSGKLVAGINADGGWSGVSHSVVLVAFPKEGNAFITTPAWAGEFCGNFALNDKGLVCMATAGQAARPEDCKTGYPGMLPLGIAAYQCSNALDAKDLYCSLDVSSPESQIFVDSDSKCFIIEHTTGCEKVRVPGEFGEKEYIIAANHYLCDEMQPSMFPKGCGWDDSQIRYQSEQTLVDEMLGEIDVSAIDTILGSHDYFENGEWHKDVWDINGESIWTPENRDVDTKCLMRGIADLNENAVYLMQGQNDVFSSFVPYSTGNYLKLVLGKSASSVCKSAFKEAKKQIWIASRDLAQSETVSEEKEEKLNQAKISIWKGISSLAKASVMGHADNALSLSLFAKATTAFCEAQCYAKLASNPANRI